MGENIDAHFKPSRSECDLLSASSLRSFLRKSRPIGVINCAAEHGSSTQMSHSHTKYLHNNLLMSINLLKECHELDIQEVLLVGSISSFPDSATNLMTESDFFNGDCNPVNYGYNMSKRILPSLTKTYQIDYKRNYKVVHLGNIYGPHMKFGHGTTLVGNLIHKVWEAKRNGTTVELYGNGMDVRSLTYVDDASWLLRQIVWEKEILEPMIVSSGYEINVANLATLIAKEMGFNGKIRFLSKEMGFTRKVAKSEVIEKYFPNFQFTSISEGLKSTIDYFLFSRKK